MALKSKKTHQKSLRLTRTVSMEAIFTKNYETIWKDSVESIYQTRKKQVSSQEDAWGPKMSHALAKHTENTHINLESVSSIILEKLHYMDFTKRKKPKHTESFLQTFFLDDEIFDEDENENDEDNAFEPQAFGISYAEGEQAIKQLSQWTHADMHAFSGARKRLNQHRTAFLGEENQSVNTTPDAMTHDADDPNNDLLDAAAWGLTELESEPVLADNLSADNLSAEDLSPMEEMKHLKDEVSPVSNSFDNDTSSDIISVDNLLHKIGFNKAKAENEAKADSPINSDETASAPAAINAQANKAEKANKARLKEQKQILKTKKNLAKKALKVQKNIEKQALQARKKAEKETLKAQRNARKQPRTALDVLNENSRRPAMPAPAMSHDAHDDVPASVQPNPQAENTAPNLSAEAILDGLASQSQIDNTPPYPQMPAMQDSADNNKYQIQTMLSNNPLPPVAMDIASSAEHQQIALHEVKNLLDSGKTDEAVPNPNKDTAASQDSTLDAFAHLQKVMAENLKQPQQ